MNKVNRVIDIGMTLHKFVDTNVQEVFLTCVSYHLTLTNVCLFSHWTYHQMHGGHSEVHSNRDLIMLPNHCIDIGINIEEANLPIVYNSFVLQAEKWMIVPQMCSDISHARLSKLKKFGDL